MPRVLSSGVATCLLQQTRNVGKVRKLEPFQLPLLSWQVESDKKPVKTGCITNPGQYRSLDQFLAQFLDPVASRTTFAKITSSSRTGREQSDIQDEFIFFLAYFLSFLHLFHHFYGRKKHRQKLQMAHR